MATNNAINTSAAAPAGVTIGGTGLATATAYGVICAGTTATGAFQSLAGLGAAGTILTSNGAAALPSFQAPAAAGVTSAVATANQVDVSAATGAVTFSIPSTFIAPGTIAATTTVTAATDLVATAGNLLLPTTSSTVGQININAIRAFHAYGTNNIFAGLNAGNFTFTTATVQDCTGIGQDALAAKTTTGGSCTALGASALARALTGEGNTGIGYAGGFNYTGAEAYNICINSSGTTGESNVLNVGRATGTGFMQLNKSFIHGIRGITTDAADAIAVLISSTGQLGTVSSSIRFKENVQDMADASSAVMNLRPVTFDYKSHPGKKQFGLIAEEVLTVMPDMVVYNQDGQVESVKYQDLAPMLLNELQKAVKMISDLQARVLALEAK